MSSQRCPIPLYPHPPLSPHRTQVESASDKHSNFPPIRERKSTPDPPISVPNHSHPRRSPVAQRQSERYSSPSEEPAPQLQLRHTPNSVAQKRTKRSKQHSSLSQEPAPSPSQLQQHLPNSGLGNRNRLNIMEAGVLVRHSKVRRQTLGLQAVILIEVMPEQFRILDVEARCRCSRG